MRVNDANGIGNNIRAVLPAERLCPGQTSRGGAYGFGTIKNGAHRAPFKLQTLYFLMLTSDR